MKLLVLKCCVASALFTIIIAILMSRQSSSRQPDHIHMYAHEHFGDLFLEADRVLAQAQAPPPSDDDSGGGQNLAGNDDHDDDDCCLTDRTQGNHSLPPFETEDTRCRRISLQRSADNSSRARGNTASHVHPARPRVSPLPPPQHALAEEKSDIAASSQISTPQKALPKTEVPLPQIEDSPVIQVNGVDWSIEPELPDFVDGGEPLGSFNNKKGAKAYFQIAKALQQQVLHNKEIGEMLYQTLCKHFEAGKKQEGVLIEENKKARKVRNAVAEVRSLKTALISANKTITSERENAKNTLQSWKQTAAERKTNLKAASDEAVEWKKKYETANKDFQVKVNELTNQIAANNLQAHKIETAEMTIQQLRARLSKWEQVEFSVVKRDTKRDADQKDKDAEATRKNNQRQTQYDRAQMGGGYRSSSAHGLLPNMSPGGLRTENVAERGRRKSRSKHYSSEEESDDSSENRRRSRRRKGKKKKRKSLDEVFENNPPQQPLPPLQPHFNQQGLPYGLSLFQQGMIPQQPYLGYDPRQQYRGYDPHQQHAFAPVQQRPRPVSMDGTSHPPQGYHHNRPFSSLQQHLPFEPEPQRQSNPSFMVNSTPTSFYGQQQQLLYAERLNEETRGVDHDDDKTERELVYDQRTRTFYTEDVETNASQNDEDEYDQEEPEEPDNEIVY